MTTVNTITPLNRETRLQLVQQLTDLMQQAVLAYDTETLQNSVEQYEQGIFHLLIVGEIKKGKSSFINALLGEDHLLPTSSDIATSTVYKIIYGEERCTKVFLKPKYNEEKGEVVTITTTEQLAAYGTEDGNPNNCKGVDFIRIELPHPLLKSGLVVVDTPGLGGLFREHADITWQHVPKADAVFFVLDSVESVISRDEQEFLRKLRKITSLIFFVQTKIDIADEERWREWQARNLEIISEELNVSIDNIPYFPLSSRLKIMADQKQSEKHLQRSGFQDLLDLLQIQLMSMKEQRLAAVLDAALIQLATQLQAEWSGQLNVLKTDGDVERHELQQAYQESSEKLNKWQKKDYANWQSLLSEALLELKSQVRTEFHNQLDYSPHGGIVGTLVNDIRESNPNAKALDANVREIQSKCIDMCNQIVFDLHRKMNMDIENCLNDLLQQLGSSIDMAAIESEAINGVGVPLVHSLHIHSDHYDRGYHMYKGGGIGSASAGTMVSLVSFIFPPAAVAIPIAGIIGMGIGAFIADQSHTAKHLEEAMHKLQDILSNSVRQAQAVALSQFDTNMTRLERKIRDLLQTALNEKQRELTQRKQELAQMVSQTEEEKLSNEKQLMQKLQTVESILTSLQIA